LIVFWIKFGLVTFACLWKKQTGRKVFFRRWRKSWLADHKGKKREMDSAAARKPVSVFLFLLARGEIPLRENIVAKCGQ